MADRSVLASRRIRVRDPGAAVESRTTARPMAGTQAAWPRCWLATPAP